MESKFWSSLSVIDISFHASMPQWPFDYQKSDSAIILPQIFLILEASISFNSIYSAILLTYKLLHLCYCKDNNFLIIFEFKVIAFANRNDRMSIVRVFGISDFPHAEQVVATLVLVLHLCIVSHDTFRPVPELEIFSCPWIGHGRTGYACSCIPGR